MDYTPASRNQGALAGPAINPILSSHHAASVPGTLAKVYGWIASLPWLFRPGVENVT